MSFEPRYTACPTCGTEFFQDEPWKRTCLPCWKQRKGIETGEARHPPAAAPTIPGDMLARLIRLCHPDKHGGSEAANVATAWLLDRRKELRA